MTTQAHLKTHYRRIPYLLAVTLAIPAGAASAESPLTAPQPPDVLYGQLFDAVQRAKIFPDQKTFADAVAKREPTAIIASWTKQHSQKGFDLKAFVLANFTLPNEREAYQPKANQPLRAHIDELWPVLTQQAKASGHYDSLLPLPHSYVVPGGRFREVYYWDSYFTMLGLAESGQWDKVRDMVANFGYELDHYGLIPNGNRSYYLSRTQPPFFSMMVDLLAKHDGDKIYQQYLPQLQKEYDYWMVGSGELKNGEANLRVVKMTNGALLNRYWDARNEPRTESWMQDIETAEQVAPQERALMYRNLRSAAASGWDFSSRWFADGKQLSTIQTTDLVPVDLNSLLYHLELVLAKSYRVDHQFRQSERYAWAASLRKTAINRYLWNDQQGWYSDYNWRKGKLRDQLTAATLFPLFLKVATNYYAERTSQAVKKQLLRPGGIVTTTRSTGQQWDAPNGWAPLQWVAVEGLMNYRKKQLSRQVGLSFLANVQATYDAKHKLVEKYVVDGKTLGGGAGGEYPLQDGFGWTNGVTLKLLDRYCPADKVCNSAHDIPLIQKMMK